MDCSEDLGADDMITVQQVAPSSILVVGSFICLRLIYLSTDLQDGFMRLKPNPKHEILEIHLRSHDLDLWEKPVSSEAVGGVRVCGAAGGAELGRRLLLAARHGDTQAVLDLMARGAPFTTDWLGTSALHLAAGGAHAQTCAVLLRAGVSRDCRTKVDRTPLHLAAHAGHTNVVSLLLDNNAALDCRDMLQMTPLHWACARGHAAVARELLARGADHRARSKFNKTPLQLARAAGHPALADLLEAHEAAALVTTTTHEAETPANRQTTQDPPKFTETKATKQTTSQPDPIKISIERNEGGAGAEAAAAMLRRHGITLLPRDEGSTVLNALQSGRSVVLSDAGKLMLKESSVLTPAPAPAPPPPSPAPKVLLSARPVLTPPAGAAVKIFTLNNKLVTLPKENKAPVKKVIDPFDTSQVQYIKLPSDAKITMLKSKASPARPAPPPSPALKLTLQKSDNALQTGAGTGNSVLYVPEQFMSNSSPKYLRTQLLAAHRTIAQLNAQLAHAKARLAQYEKV